MENIKGRDRAFQRRITVHSDDVKRFHDILGSLPHDTDWQCLASYEDRAVYIARLKKQDILCLKLALRVEVSKLKPTSRRAFFI